MEKTRIAKLEAIDEKTIICGIDVAKKVHWAQFVDWRGIPVGKAVKFKNNKAGLEHIVAEAKRRCKETGKEKVITGMEPTGPYWKAMARWLESEGLEVVGVNTYHTKQAKELDDNSPTKNDKKDALVIARLVKDGRYFHPYLPENTYAELRVTANHRLMLVKRMNAVKNRIIGILDEYFPEFVTVFKCPLKGKASRQILKNCPFPQHILEIGIAGVWAEIKKAVKKTVGKKKAEQLLVAAADSIGVRHGADSARFQMRLLLDELEFFEMQLIQVKARMEELLGQTGYKDLLLGIDGIGIISAASFLAETGDPMRFDKPRQIHRLAGYDLVENSSGQNKSGTSISKRGRKQLRALLYRMAMVMVASNSELKQLYLYLRTRLKNPLKGKQALIVVSKKIVTIIYQMMKTRTEYKPVLVLGPVRREQLRLAA